MHEPVPNSRMRYQVAALFDRPVFGEVSRNKGREGAVSAVVWRLSRRSERPESGRVRAGARLLCGLSSLS
jgi:hypothetical protein